MRVPVSCTVVVCGSSQVCEAACDAVLDCVIFEDEAFDDEINDALLVKD